MVPELGIPELREVFVRTYRVVYRIHEREVQVITVFEGHRLFPDDVDPEGDPGEGA
jgi:plasmid stabilization system protein ParE